MMYRKIPYVKFSVLLQSLLLKFPPKHIKKNLVYIFVGDGYGDLFHTVNCNIDSR